MKVLHAAVNLSLIVGLCSLVIPLARSRLTTEETDRPVPQSKLRQFVVSRYVKSPKDHQASLERFWYREKLLRSIQARWTLVSVIPLNFWPKGNLSIHDEIAWVESLWQLDITAPGYI
jgi:hypothetical protein